MSYDLSDEIKSKSRQFNKDYEKLFSEYLTKSKVTNSKLRNNEE